MKPTYSLTHLPDHALLQDTAVAVANGRKSTAWLIAHLAEVDLRKLYLPAAYSTMYHYCVGELHMSEDEASRRIRVARVAREFPVIFEMLAGNRLHLTAVLLLAPVLDRTNAAGLLEAATHKSKAEVEHLLAERFPQPDVTSVLRAAPAPQVSERTLPAAASSTVESVTVGGVQKSAYPSALARVVPSQPIVPVKSEVPLPESPRVAPLSPGRYELRVTLDQATHDKLRRLQELLSHAVPSGDIAEVLGRAFDMAIETLEKRRFAATSRPGTRRGSKSARHIPAHVRRGVCQRDGEQCTFVSDEGKRCAERRFLEFDHVRPVARGGQATVENTRLRCRAHNQYEAEQVYGSGFMRDKRQAARARAETASMLRGLAAERARMRPGAPPAPRGSHA